jgi:UDP-glucose 4-epimerase
MRVLVTGGAGFIGSHVVDAYIQADHEVWALDDLSRGKREQVNPHAHFVRMDLCCPDLKDLLAEGNFDCINHHAAQIDVRVSVADPTRDAMINIVGTLNLLEAARAHGVPRVIFASTGGAIYGEQRHFPATEQHPTSPISPYGVAKLAVENYLEYYRKVHGLRYVVLRYANVYGPRQDPEGEAGVVAIFCGKVLRGQRLIIYGDGEQTRDYVYVGDVARANLLALRYLTTSVESVESVESIESGRSFGSRLNRLNNSTTQRLNDSSSGPRSLPAAGCPPRESAAPLSRGQLPAASRDSMDSRTQKLKNSINVFNIGTGIEISVNALAATLLEAADADCPVANQPARPGEQERSVIDPSLARLVLGWEPLISVTEGLDQTLAWFRSKEAVSIQSVGKYR